MSLVADIGFGLPRQEAMRTCLVGAAMGRKLGLPESEISDIFYASLLMHIGCVSLSHEAADFMGDELVAMGTVARTNLDSKRDWMQTLVPEIVRGLGLTEQARMVAGLISKGKSFGFNYDTGSCEVGRDTARRIGLPPSTQDALYQMSESWQGKWAPNGLKGNDITISARVVRVAHDAAVFDDFGDEETAKEAVAIRSGIGLDPELVDLFQDHATEFLAEANEWDPRERILEVEPHPHVEVTQEQLPEVAAAFGDIADLKSPFMHGHSGRVTELSVAAAERLGLRSETVEHVRLAAPLHNVGRVGISNKIWEKPGPLNSAEWEQVRMHAYHSERILATSPSLEPLSRTAGMHHERQDGSGYHRSCRKADISMPAAIIGAADVLAALTQDRPHRKGLRKDEARAHLSAEARAGRFDTEIVAALLDADDGNSARRRTPLNPAGLTSREIEVLRLVAEGLTNRELAGRLYISRRTAEHHVQHIYSKIGVSTRPAAALFALQNGLLDLEEARR